MCANPTTLHKRSEELVHISMEVTHCHEQHNAPNLILILFEFLRFKHFSYILFFLNFLTTIPSLNTLYIAWKKQMKNCEASGRKWYCLISSLNHRIFMKKLKKTTKNSKIYASIQIKKPNRGVPHTT